MCPSQLHELKEGDGIIPHWEMEIWFPKEEEVWMLDWQRTDVHDLVAIALVGPLQAACDLF